MSSLGQSLKQKKAIVLFVERCGRPTMRHDLILSPYLMDPREFKTLLHEPLWHVCPAGMPLAMWILVNLGDPVPSSSPSVMLLFLISCRRPAQDAVGVSRKNF